MIRCFNNSEAGNRKTLRKKLKKSLISLFIHGKILSWVTNSMVEYSAFNRIVLGSSPR